jgi:hypothetical protein
VAEELPQFKGQRFLEQAEHHQRGHLKTELPPAAEVFRAPAIPIPVLCTLQKKIRQGFENA